MKTNKVTLVGTIIAPFEFYYEGKAGKRYKTLISVKRDSGVEDIIPLMIYPEIANPDVDMTGTLVRIKGYFSSYNHTEDGVRRLLLYVVPSEFEVLESCDDELLTTNIIELDGYLCKPPVVRETPLGRRIADLIVAVNRQNGKSDYLPAIVWGNKANYAGTLDVRSHVKISGRIQSRKYRKAISETEYDERTAYEVSVNRLKLILDTEEIDSTQE